MSFLQVEELLLVVLVVSIAEAYLEHLLVPVVHDLDGVVVLGAENALKVGKEEVVGLLRVDQVVPLVHGVVVCEGLLVVVKLALHALDELRELALLLKCFEAGGDCQVI